MGGYLQVIGNAFGHGCNLSHNERRRLICENCSVVRVITFGQYSIYFVQAAWWGRSVNGRHNNGNNTPSRRNDARYPGHIVRIVITATLAPQTLLLV